MNDNDIKNLRWVRIINPDLIPRYLVDQVKDKEFTVDDFYKYQNLICMDDGKINPFNHLYALTDKENFIKGMLWFTVDPLTKNVLINTYSIDKEYWYNGKAVEYLFDHMCNILEKFDLKKIYWANRYPKHAERYGFKKSKSVLMEYTRGTKDGINSARGCEAQEEHQHVDTGATRTDDKPVDRPRTKSTRRSRTVSPT